MIAMICENCGGELTPSARFCPTCGTAVRGRTATEERRTVTVLFADLVGSTELGEELDPEVTRTLIDRFFRLCADQVRRHGGTVQAFSGDATVAVFGLKTAHEDDPERAVRAADAIQAALDLQGGAWMPRDGMRLQARIGIECGTVVVGDPYGGSTAATGDCFNVAARLEQQAKPGEVVIGPSVAAATRGAVTSELIGSLLLKGKREPVNAWRVTAVAPQPAGRRGVEGLRAPLIGRDDELQLLLRAWQRSRAERKTILFTIIGSPGVGKSRLAKEFIDRVQPEGARMLKGRCLAYGDAITFWPLAEMVRQATGLSAEVPTSDAIRRIAEVANSQEVAERLALALGLEPEASSQTIGRDREIAWAFRRLVEILALQQPMVLFFEDIHWAEPQLIDLIEYLATWAKDTSLFIVCVGRPELLDRRPNFGSGRIEASRIMLEPLNRDHASTLLDQLLHAGELSPQLRDQILERSEGNPLYVEEMLRMLIDERVIMMEDRRWIVSDRSNELRVPTTVQALIQARLDTLQAPVRKMLQAASVIGRNFERRYLVALLDDASDLDRQLDDAVLRDLIQEDPAGSTPGYRFKHMLIRDMAYAAVPKARRAEWHEKLAEAMTADAVQRAEIADLQACHFETAAILTGELRTDAGGVLHEVAVDGLAAASRRASAREDYRSALSFAERSLQLAPDGERKLDLEWLRIEAAFRLGQSARSAQLAKGLREQAQTVGRSDLIGRALMVESAHASSTEGPAVGIPMAEKARALLHEAGDPLEVDAAREMSWRGWWSGDLDLSFADYADLRALARRLDHPGVELEAVLWQAIIRNSQNRAAEGTGLLQEAMELGASIGSRMTRATAEAEYVAWQGTVKRAEPALHRLTGLIPELDELGLVEPLISAVMTAGLFSRWIGDLEGAVRWHQRAAELCTTLSQGGMRTEAYRFLSEDLLERGDVNAAEVEALRAIELTLPNDWASVATTKMALGRVRDLQGRDKESLELLEAAAQGIEKTGFVVTRHEMYIALAEFYLRRGRTTEGEEWLGKTFESVSSLPSESAMVREIHRRAQRHQGSARPLRKA